MNIRMNEKKWSILMGAMLFASTHLLAQNGDPVLMTINGKPITRSEFEYSYNKNNAAAAVDKKSVDQYVDLFINYKLKVEAALDAKLDTTQAFKSEFSTYRDQQIKSSFLTDADVEAEARRIYETTRQRIDNNGGMREVSHILMLLGQQATADEQRVAKQRIDSIYQALQQGADFADLAKRLSQDPGTAQKGGSLSWIVKGQTFPEFENEVWKLNVGQMSKPFTSPAGWHIVKVTGKQNFFSYESQHKDILNYIDQANLREQILANKIDTLAKERHITPEALVDQRREEMTKKDANLKYLIQEYHDGLLLYELSNRMVWEKAARDSVGLEQWFKRHKKDYKWDEPRYRGIAYYTREEADIKAVRNTVKNLPFEQWAEQLRKTFNANGTLRIKVEQSLFKKGDNPLVDNYVFKDKQELKPEKDYPFAAVYGKKLKNPKELSDVRAQVLADYQDSLEKEWVAQLRRHYSVTINNDVLRTVNNH